MPKTAEIGRTVLGRSIIAEFYPAASYARVRPPAILFGAIHGDEPLGTFCLQELARDLAATPPGRDTWLVGALNLDGLLGGSKNNANDVDLNRNFPASNWTAAHRPGYASGAEPASEPETRALISLIAHARAERLVALHSPFRTVNWDGRGESLAIAMAERNGYGASAEIGYPTPGSFGSYYGIDRDLEVVTLEIPLQDEARAWSENRAALRYCLDLPS